MTCCKSWIIDVFLLNSRFFNESTLLRTDEDSAEHRECEDKKGEGSSEAHQKIYGKHPEDNYGKKRADIQ